MNWLRKPNRIKIEKLESLKDELIDNLILENVIESNIKISCNQIKINNLIKYDRFGYDELMRKHNGLNDNINL